jgi:hypothetical protein
MPSAHGLLPLQLPATSEPTALETRTKAINTTSRCAFIFPIFPYNNLLQTSTTILSLDAQKHELIRPEKFWRSQN